MISANIPCANALSQLEQAIEIFLTQKKITMIVKLHFKENINTKAAHARVMISKMI